MRRSLRLSGIAAIGVIAVVSASARAESVLRIAMTAGDIPANKTEPMTEAAWLDPILRPIRSFRLAYVPVVMVYFAYGALGLIDVTRDFWIKESLSLTPSMDGRWKIVSV